jgi:hypothetical protein
MPSGGRDQPLRRVMVRCSFIQTIRLQRSCEVDGRTVGIEWGLDFNKAIENSGVVVIVGYGAREAIGSAA